MKSDGPPLSVGVCGVLSRLDRYHHPVTPTTCGGTELRSWALAAKGGRL